MCSEYEGRLGWALEIGVVKNLALRKTLLNRPILSLLIDNHCLHSFR